MERSLWKSQHQQVLFHETPRTWMIRNSVQQISFQETPDGRINYHWSAHPLNIRDLEEVPWLDIHPDNLIWVEPTPAETFRFSAYRLDTVASGALEFRLTFSGAGLVVSLIWEFYPRSAFVRTHVEVQNRGETAMILRDPRSFFLPRPLDGSMDLITVRGLRRYRPEVVERPSFALRTQTLEEGMECRFFSRFRSSEENLPWFALRAAGRGETVIGALEWSGEWHISLDVPTQGPVGIWAGLLDYQRELNPGEKLSSPVGIWGMLPTADPGEAIAAWHAWLRLYRRPACSRAIPLIPLNTWRPWGTALAAETLARDMDLAADLGLDAFIVDVGWHAGSPESGRNFSPGLGDYAVHPGKFPQGLAPLAEKAQALGKVFGLWVEPERVDGALVGRDQLWKPEWLSRQGDQLVVERDAEDVRYQVCLGSPEARAHVVETLSRLIRDNQIGWLRWDNNFWENCGGENHGHHPGEGNAAQISGWYETLDFLRLHFPDLIVENASGGGANRLDPGSYSRTHLAWLTDEAADAEALRDALAGASCMLPPEYFNTWFLLPAADLPAAEQWYLFRSALLMNWGFSEPLGRLSESDQQRLRQFVMSARQIRPYLRGDFTWLNAPWNPDQILAAEAYQFHTPEHDEGLILAFRRPGAPAQARLYPRLANPDRTWIFRFLDSKMTAEVRGADLAKGVEITFATEPGSELIYYQAV